MKSKRKHLMVLALLLSAGCAAYQLEPLSANHPAYPDAAAAPERPVSKTLAYTRADIPSAQPVSGYPGRPSRSAIRPHSTEDSGG